MARIIFTVLALLISLPTFADLADKFSNFIGFTIVTRKNIAGWYDENGKKGDEFEGCEYGRVIVFTDNTILHCAGYTYTYAYMPTAVILSDGRIWKMVVGNEVYDVFI